MIEINQFIRSNFIKLCSLITIKNKLLITTLRDITNPSSIMSFYTNQLTDRDQADHDRIPLESNCSRGLREPLRCQKNEQKKKTLAGETFRPRCSIFSGTGRNWSLKARQQETTPFVRINAAGSSANWRVYTSIRHAGMIIDSGIAARAID